MRWSLGAVFCLLLLGLGAFSQGSLKSEADFDPAIFLLPPAKSRGHAMWNFNLSTLNENSVVSGIEELAKLNYGGVFHRSGRWTDDRAISSLLEDVSDAEAERPGRRFSQR
jgi:hypothetical protein